MWRWLKSKRREKSENKNGAVLELDLLNHRNST